MTARAETGEDMGMQDAHRRLANVVRVGKVAEINEATGQVRVRAGEFLTDWISFAAPRAGGDRTWWMPEAGEQVVIASPSGDMAQAVVLGAIYQDAHPAPANSKDKHRTEYADGSVVEYDRAAHRLTADLGATKITADRSQVVITVGSTKMTMTAAGTVFDGPVTINGLLTYTQGMSGTGGGGAAATINGSIQVIGGEVSADGIGLKAHKHGGVQAGGSNTSSSVP